jgi:hypothetical protein
MSAFNGSVTVFLIQHRAKRNITLALPPRGPDVGQETAYRRSPIGVPMQPAALADHLPQ